MPVIDVFSESGEQLASIAAQSGDKLSEALWLSGRLPPRPLCNGLGLCGRCRARFAQAAPEPHAGDKAFFTQGQLADGWRLACRHFVPDTARLRLHIAEAKAATAVKPRNARPMGDAFLGVDLGTTSIEWRAFAENDTTIATGTMWNPQAGAGADVISRLEYAMRPGGIARLSQLVLRALAGIAADVNAAGHTVARACIAANSAMTEILLGKDISGLAAAPYGLSFTGAPDIKLDLPNNKSLNAVFPPLPSPFAGGDISAGLLALLRGGAKPPFMLIDLGTNAELAIVADRLYLASAPLGPAMEGIGPACGQAAGPGVITAFRAAPGGLMPVFFDADQNARGISATGYLSLLAILLNLGIMDSSGQMRKGAAMPFADKIAQNLTSEGLLLPCGMILKPADIEILLKVKAALAVAIERILSLAQIAPAALSRLYLAGALGKHANMADLAALNFMPRALAAKCAASGNTSLAGACILAAEPGQYADLASLCQNAVVADLANDPHFLPAYLAAMRWGQ